MWSCGFFCLWKSGGGQSSRDAEKSGTESPAQSKTPSRSSSFDVALQLASSKLQQSATAKSLSTGTKNISRKPVTDCSEGLSLSLSLKLVSRRP